MADNFANPNYADDDVNMVMGIFNAIEDTLEMVRCYKLSFCFILCLSA